LLFRKVTGDYPHGYDCHLGPMDGLAIAEDSMAIYRSRSKMHPNADVRLHIAEVLNVQILLI